MTLPPVSMNLRKFIDSCKKLRLWPLREGLILVGFRDVLQQYVTESRVIICANIVTAGYGWAWHHRGNVTIEDALKNCPPTSIAFPLIGFDEEMLW